MEGQRISTESRLKYNSDRQLTGTVIEADYELIDVRFVIYKGAKIGAHKFILRDSPEISQYYSEKICGTTGLVVIDVPRDITAEALDRVLSYIYGEPIDEVLGIGITSVRPQKISDFAEALDYFKIDAEVVWTKLLKASVFWMLPTKTIYELTQAMQLESELVQDAFVDWMYLDEPNRLHQFSFKLCQLRKLYKFRLQDTNGDNDVVESFQLTQDLLSNSHPTVNQSSSKTVQRGVPIDNSTSSGTNPVVQNGPSTSTSNNSKKRKSENPPTTSTKTSSLASSSSGTNPVVQNGSASSSTNNDSKKPKTLNLTTPTPTKLKPSVPETQTDMEPPRCFTAASETDSDNSSDSECEWLASTTTVGSAYYPQIGDDLVYFRQGHELYINEVKSSRLYSIDNKFMGSVPFIVNPSLPAQVSCRLIQISYKYKPEAKTVLVRLKLAGTDWETGELMPHISYLVTYHDMEDVDEFLILRQCYDKSLVYKSSVGDRIRSLTYKKFYFGTVSDIAPFSTQFPDSEFKRYKIIWDVDGEEDEFSLWELDLLPRETPKQTVPAKATPDEIRNYHALDAYEVDPSDWPPNGDRDAECERITNKLFKVMQMVEAVPFLEPVDTNIYPDYIARVQCPIDLHTIKTRLENRFYRRKEALIYDIKLLNKNCETYNKPNSSIIHDSRLIRDLLLNIVDDVAEP